jgi:hypothetical protein
LEALIGVVLDLVPELLAANGLAHGPELDQVPVRVVAERHATAHRAA